MSGQNRISAALLTGRRPLIMGILNVTPDSFSDGGNYAHLDAALAHARKLIAYGADIIDIGAESTRPGAQTVPFDVEMARVIPVIAALRAQSNVPITIDTRKPEVAKAAVLAGADGWNDVSALSFSPDSLATAAALNVPVILMHSQGSPETMQNQPAYKNIVVDVRDYLVRAMGQGIAAGIRRDHIILDPGIGFGKNGDHNYALLAEMGKLTALGLPLLVGASRKRLIEAADKSATDPNNRLGGSLAIALYAAKMGAAIVRVHDVYETRQAFLINDAIENGL